MTTFSLILSQIKEQYADLFDEEALGQPDETELTVEVADIDVPTREELKDQPAIERLVDLPGSDEVGDWLEVDGDIDFEESTILAGQDNAFGGRPSRVGLELLAVYLPFHFYPEGHWGIRFFERPMWYFTAALHRRHRSLPLQHMLKIATYSVARHEFLHYLVELEALDMEVKTHRRVYRPYWDQVYKAAYPSLDCLEETVANVWAWDNPAIRSPVQLQQLFRSEMRRIPYPAYRAGADPNDVREREDLLNAQLLQCVIRPATTPPVWGSLPRPYVQPWTRYENVSFTMNRSLGGQLASLLNARPLRKTIRIRHR